MSTDLVSFNLSTDRFDALKILSVLLSDTTTGASMGIPEAKLKERTSLAMDVLRRMLFYLAQEGFVTYELLQVGTGGSTDYYFKVAKEVKVDVSRPRPEKPT